MDNHNNEELLTRETTLHLRHLIDLVAMVTLYAIFVMGIMGNLFDLPAPRFLLG